MTEQTRKNVEAAFVGEAKAYFRLMASCPEEERVPAGREVFRAVSSGRQSARRAISSCSRRFIRPKKT